MRFLRILVFLLAAALLGFATVVAVKDTTAISGYQETIDANQKDVEELASEYSRQKILSQGNMESVKALPDSVRRKQSAILAAQIDRMDKKIRKLAMDKKEKERLVRRDLRRQEALKAHMSKWAGVPAGAGLILIIAGIVAGRLARR